MATKDYYLGLSLAHNAVGYAVTDTEYNPLNFKGDPLLGVSEFEAAKTAEERRGFRTGRRRLDRKQHRIELLQELFAPAINEVDPHFFIRIRESALWAEDKTVSAEQGVYFNSNAFSDKDYYKKYPTIHHLINELMESTEPHDVRMVYMAAAWLVAHRGHFLSPVSEDNVIAATDIESAYNALMDYFPEDQKPWDCSPAAFGEVLRKKARISEKEKEFFELLYNGNKPTHLVYDMMDEEAPIISRAGIIKLFAGGKIAAKKLFLHNEDKYEDITLCLSDSEEVIEAAITALDEDDAELIVRLKAVYDWSILADILGDANTISAAKIHTFEQHKQDLRFLKRFLKKYNPKMYEPVFVESGTANYSWYVKSDIEEKTSKRKSYKMEEFYKLLKKAVEGIEVEACDKEAYEDMLARIEFRTFLPKQRHTDNRVIPYQLYIVELKKILKNASEYLPFLSVKDKDGLTAVDKIVSIFKFRIPYFVGPLNAASPFAWLVRKAGTIYPWNFNSMVDLDASEAAFIRNLTGRCTYLPEEHVLPKHSLCYSKFTVLNEINPLKINGVNITPLQKQEIYTGLFEQKNSVSYKALRSYCIKKGWMREADNLTGVDIAGVRASLMPWNAFRRLLKKGILTEAEVEQIIERIACTDDKNRLTKWIMSQYPHVDTEDVKYIVSLKSKIKDFGRLSRRFLCEMEGIDKETGQVFTILQALWDTNNTLMELLSGRFTFVDEAKSATQEYYAANSFSMQDRMDKMYLSNPVRRQIYRTLAVIKDIVKVMGGAPAKIFMDSYRSADNSGKGKRTVSRKSQILALYNSILKKSVSEDIVELKNLLEEMDESTLQNDRWYFYFLQLGRCLYTGKRINRKELFDNLLYEIGHIYPPSIVKDSSLHNLVLVSAQENALKSDDYPLSADIRFRMKEYWNSLLEWGLISKEKCARLTRSTAFSEKEKEEFVNRVLVETHQSNKALSDILSENFPRTKVINVKHDLVSEFRMEYSMFSSRILNPLHQAKDAYLNIPVGNVYYERFNKNFFRVSQEYTLDTRELFSNPVWVNNVRIWQGTRDTYKVRDVLLCDFIRLSHFSLYKKGGISDLQPLPAVSASPLMLPRKKGLDVEKYGGYAKVAVAGFALVKYWIKDKTDIMFAPIELHTINRFNSSSVAAAEVAKEVVEKILGQRVSRVDLLLNGRLIKVQSVLSFDGYRVCLRCKTSGGKILGLGPLTPLLVPARTEQYIKRLESFNNKLRRNDKAKLSPDNKRITAEFNLELYDALQRKMVSPPFNKRPGGQVVSTQMSLGRDMFVALPLEKQVNFLCNIVAFFNATLVDISAIGGSKNAGSTVISNKLSSWLGKYKDVRIIDQSPAGIFEQKSCNLLNLL